MPRLFLLTASLLISAGATAQPLDPIAEGAPPAGTQRALLVAINTYSPPGATLVRRVSDLRGPLNDLRLMREVLIERGVDSTHIETLTEGEATREGIERAVLAWIGRAAPGDHLTFYFAGHGAYADTLWVGPDGEAHPRLQTVVPADGALGAPDLSDKTLRMWWNRALARVQAGGASGSLTVIQDNCHSGGGARSVLEDPDPPQARQAAPARSVTFPEASAVGAPIESEGRGALVIAATRPEQRALEDHVPHSVVGGGGGQHGVFTAAFVRALRAMPPGASPRDVITATNGYVEAMGFAQVASAFGDGPLFGEAGASDGGAAVVVAGVERDGTVVLRSGLFAGLGPGSDTDPQDNATLVRTYTTDSDGSPLADSSVALRVDRADATRSWAAVTGGDPASVRVGDRFRITTYVPPPGDPLRLWMPEDMAAVAPYAPEGADLEALAVATEALREALRERVDADGDMEWTADPTLADYWLLGETGREGALRWVRPAELADSLYLNLPRHRPAGPGEDRGAVELFRAANRAADANYWAVSLQPPAGSDEAFPVQLLGLRRLSDGKVIRPDSTGALALTANSVKCSESPQQRDCYRLAVGLTAEDYEAYRSGAGGRRQYTRYAYVTTVDPEGTACLLLPYAGCDSSEDAFDYRLNVVDESALEAALTAEGDTVYVFAVPDGTTWPFNFFAPSNHGRHTYVLLTTTEEFEGDAETLQWPALHAGTQRRTDIATPPLPTWGLHRLHIDVAPAPPSD